MSPTASWDGCRSSSRSRMRTRRRLPGRFSVPGTRGRSRGGGLMSYVDGFIIPVPKRNLRAYKRMATLGRNVWTKHGALDYKECAGDDLVSKWGKSFTQMMKLKRGET